MKTLILRINFEQNCKIVAWFSQTQSVSWGLINIVCLKYFNFKWVRFEKRTNEINEVCQEHSKIFCVTVCRWFFHLPSTRRISIWENNSKEACFEWQAISFGVGVARGSALSFSSAKPFVSIITKLLTLFPSEYLTLRAIFLRHSFFIALSFAPLGFSRIFTSGETRSITSPGPSAWHPLLLPSPPSPADDPGRLHLMLFSRPNECRNCHDITLSFSPEAWWAFNQYW